MKVGVVVVVVVVAGSWGEVEVEVDVFEARALGARRGGGETALYLYVFDRGLAGRCFELYKQSGKGYISTVYRRSTRLETRCLVFSTCRTTRRGC